ncbi:hypothetical protein ACFPVX_24670 [Cohnella faecalis]|uniref:Uncharacterized protein n=1 Tax=Cohnella faecalis TaxID=2315694 RepID=A0A398CHX6_9BACL|nr:hypothetical protein [Cohnella faecalis]RIE02856.1 hypothetical protein D3H35_19710 [Cohnella faecalis]
MKNIYTNIILTAMLLCLIIIAIKDKNNITLEPNPVPEVVVNSSSEFVQIAPTVIGIKDNGTHTGIQGQLLIFELKGDSKTFTFRGTLNYEDYMNHPEKYGIPIKK